MTPEFVRNPYNYDSDEASEETGLECKDESLTEQEHAEEADINYIADTFMRTGEIPQVLQLPTPMDFDGIFDFQTAMNTIAIAKQEFMSLPAKVRTRFANDPQQLLDFVQDEDNYEEAVKLGFIPKKEIQNERRTEENTRGQQEETPGQDRTGGNQEASTTTKNTRP